MILFNIIEASNACRISGPYQITLDIPPAFPFEIDGVHARESAVAEFDLDDFIGLLLPIDSYFLDDLAFFVKPDFDLAANFVLDTAQNQRTLTLPDEALIVVQSGNPDFAQGAVDDAMDTTYSFKGGSYTIPGGQSLPLSQTIQGIINLGVPAQGHQDISLAQLQSLGFVENNVIKFKLIHVIHGAGGVTLGIDVPQC